MTIARLLVCASTVLAPFQTVFGQPSAPYMVLDARTPCRAATDTAQRIVRLYDAGLIIDVERDAQVGGKQWLSTQSAYVSGPHPFCWVERSSTAMFDHAHPEPALLALTERSSEPARRMPFEDLVAVENVLLGQYTSAFQQSGLLQFRRLLIVAKANATRDALAKNPLEVAWVLAHAETLAQDPFAVGAYPLAAPFWELYDRFKIAPWADELAWHAAQLARPTDECYSHCVLSARIIEGPMQYWLRLPHGLNVAAALELATKMAKYAADLACYDRKERPTSHSESPVPPQLLSTIRGSLTLVSLETKRALLDELAKAEAKCR